MGLREGAPRRRGGRQVSWGAGRHGRASVLPGRQEAADGARGTPRTENECCPRNKPS